MIFSESKLRSMRGKGEGSFVVLSQDKIRRALCNGKNFGHENGTPHPPHDHENQKINTN